MIRKLCRSTLLGAAALTSCGGDGSTKPEVDYSRLQPAQLSAAPLQPATGEALANHLRNGLRLQLTGARHGGGAAGGEQPPVAPVPQPTPAAPGDAGGGAYSDTNVHVTGVDEADVAKYDGQHWYIATAPTYSDYTIDNSTGIRIARLDAATPAATIVADYPLSDEFGAATALYLSDETSQQLTVLRNRWGSIMPALPGAPLPLADAGLLPLPYPESGAVELTLLDVSTPAAPTLAHRIEIDGTLLDSRRIDDTLYLVTRFDPWLRPLAYEAGDSTRRAANEAVLGAAPATQLMPQVRSDAGTRPLADSCLLQSTDQDQGFGTLVFITAVDLAAGEIHSSVCVSGNYGGLAMFPEALYLSGDLPDGSTVLHKFEVAATGVSYAASGAVRGSLSGRADPAFRIDHRAGLTRVVTSSHNWFGGGGIALPPTGPVPVPIDPAPPVGTSTPAVPPELADAAPMPVAPPPPVDELDHFLTILEQQGNALVAVGELPNSARPDPIGKPGEDLYTVRFEDDRAYLVTFRRTDPLYAIDLSDASDPYIAGELQVPGFASYMHPLEGDYLFTLGMDADAEGRVQGLKMELVSTAAADPVSLATVLLPDAYSSEALHDLRALSVLKLDANRYRFALPVTYLSGNGGNASAFSSGLQLLEVDLTSETLTNAGRVTAAATSNADSGRQRGLLQADAVFYTANNQVLAAPFTEPEAAQLAVALDAPEPCPPVVLPSFVAEVLLADGAASSCPTATLVHYRYNESSQPLSTAVVAGTPSASGSCQYTGPDGEYGDFLLTLEQPGYYQGQLYFTVYRDRCGSVTQQVQTVLYPRDELVCDARAAPAIALELSLGDQGDGACAASAVAYSENDQQPYPLEAFIPPSLPGEPQSYCYFEGAHEIPGVFKLEVSLAGYDSQSLSVEVPKGECHVQTQTIGMELQPSP